MNFKITDGLFGNVQVVFETIVCCKCKVPFAVTQTHRKKLMDTGETFYCPNGHSQYYSESSCDKVKKELEKKKADLEKAYEKNGELHRTVWNLKDQLTEARKTKCTFCGKKSIHIDKHIKKYH